MQTHVLNKRGEVLHIMDTEKYKQIIIEMLKQIDDMNILIKIYTVIKTFLS